MLAQGRLTYIADMAIAVTDTSAFVQATWQSPARLLSDTTAAQASGAVSGILSTCSDVAVSGGEQRCGRFHGFHSGPYRPTNINRNPFSSRLCQCPML